MTPLPVPSVVLFVTDVARVAAFYEAVAAMRRVAADDDHVVLTLDGFELVVHQLRGEPEPARAEDGSVDAREDSYTKVALPVASIAAARTVAAAHGGAIKPAEFEWTWAARAFRACDGHDPEGNVIQVREAAP